MNWLSFFLGVLVGWVVEWLIDLFYWRRKYQSCCEEREALQVRLAEAERRIRTFQVKGRDAELDVDLEAPKVVLPAADLDVDLEAPKVALPAADLDVDLEAPEVALPAVDLDVGLETPEVVLPAADLDVDLEAPEVALPAADLDVELEAPEVEVPDAGIDAVFDDLRTRFPDVNLDGSIGRLKAKFPDLDLKTALLGLKADFPDLDLDGAFDGLKARFPRLGRDAELDIDLEAPEVALPPVIPQQPDDLKRIEGIGPKISRLLQDNGILTFAQLTVASPDRLWAILHEAGPRFQLANPESWPEQAKLAADGAWDELQALQDRLIAGRETRRWDR